MAPLIPTTADQSPFYFQLSAHELAHVEHLSAPETRLLSYLFSALHTGLEIDYRLSSIPTTKIDKATSSGVATWKYIKLATSTPFNTDKYLALRCAAPSLKYIRTTLPEIEIKSDNWKPIWQLCLWRTFGVGNAAHLKDLTFVDAGAGAGVEPPSDEEIVKIITAWITKSKLAMPVYGQFMVERGKIPEMVGKFAAFAITIATFTPERKMPFAEVYELLARGEIPHVPEGGLIVWLLVSDLCEYGLCYQPTVKDLWKHIQMTKASGPKKALELATESGIMEADEKTLTRVWGVLDDPPQNMIALRQLVTDCEAVQGRKLNVVDLEHALCKIGRMESMIDKSKARKRKRDLDDEERAAKSFLGR